MFSIVLDIDNTIAVIYIIAGGSEGLLLLRSNSFTNILKDFLDVLHTTNNLFLGFTGEIHIRTAKVRNCFGSRSLLGNHVCNRRHNLRMLLDGHLQVAIVVHVVIINNHFSRGTHSTNGSVSTLIGHTAFFRYRVG